MASRQITAKLDATRCRAHRGFNYSALGIVSFEFVLSLDQQGAMAPGCSRASKHILPTFASYIMKFVWCLHREVLQQSGPRVKEWIVTKLLKFSLNAARRSDQKLLISFSSSRSRLAQCFFCSTKARLAVG